MVSFEHGPVGDEHSPHVRVEIVVAASGAVGRGDHELFLLVVAEAEVGDLAVVAYLKGLVVHEHEGNALDGGDDDVADARVVGVVESVGQVGFKRDRGARYAGQLH